MNYYNDFKTEPWLFELIESEFIPPGEIDARDIAEVVPEDLVGFDQHHFFHGIGGWPYALTIAGWNPARPIWTASLPCQPFSFAGKGKGHEDERHLWPAFHALVEKCRPPVLVGEQTASEDGRAWLSAVFVDLEAMGYAVSGADLCAAGVGAPQPRQRLFWLAYSDGDESSSRHLESDPGADRRNDTCRGGEVGIVHNENHGMGHTESTDCRRDAGGVCGTQTESGGEGCADGGIDFVPRDAGQDGAWSDCVFLPCADPVKGIVWRPVEREAQSRACEMADGIPACLVRSGDKGASETAWQTSEAAQMRISGYGNAIVPQLAAVFLESVMETLDEISRVWDTGRA